VALSVPSQDATAVGGAVTSGLSVDVYTSGTNGTTLLAQRVLVLDTSTSSGANTSSSAKSESLSWVTLASPPELVAQLVAASRLGNLYLTIPGEGIDTGMTSSSSQAGEVADDARTRSGTTTR
jgi:Flp pilus assembly protein CpaB